MKADELKSLILTLQDTKDKERRKKLTERKEILDDYFNGKQRDRHKSNS